MAKDQTIHDLKERLSRAIATLETQLGDLGQTLLTLKRDAEGARSLEVGQFEPVASDIRRWIEIALELEIQLERIGKAERKVGGGPTLDLDEARSAIGRRLDRLRRARSSEGVPE